MLAPMTLGESAEVMRRWAALAPTAGEVTWTPVQAMIEAAEAYGRDCEGRVRELAAKYKAKLGDLGDPLSVEMTWLERSYEPAYSRWLAWVLEQLGSADAVWRVLGLPDPPAQVKLGTRTEVEIPPEGRLDIVVDCDGVPSVVVETKLRPAEGYDLDVQLGLYRKKVDDWHAKGVLIVLDAEKDSYEGFVVRRWKDVCVGLRSELPDVPRGKPRVVVAMILAFVGAVEQNLLGFPSLESLATSPMLNPRVAAHIEDSMKETV